MSGQNTKSRATAQRSARAHPLALTMISGLPNHRNVSTSYQLVTAVLYSGRPGMAAGDPRGRRRPSAAQELAVQDAAAGLDS